MSLTSDILFAYLKDIFFASPGARLDLSKLDEDFVKFGEGLAYFASCFSQYNDFAKALAQGDLSVSPPPPENELAAPLKSLHANLRHLTWQSKQVSKGDYKQRVDFMGEFADSFNTMVKQLADRQRKLEDEIEVSHKHAISLEQSNLLLSNLTSYIPQQIFVVNLLNHEILLLNDMARSEINLDPQYIEKLMGILPDHEGLSGSYYLDVQLGQGNQERYLAINAYITEWEKKHAVALVINDVSAEKRQIKELEDHAYRDSLTLAYNRFFGMLSLNEWLSEKRCFALVFVDLDNLKHINDAYGHKEGDNYIISAARHMQAFSQDALICRIGGDEFMLLIPDMDEEQAKRRMADICKAVENDEHLKGKDFRYSISVGIVAVDAGNEMPSSALLSTADERMYFHKRAKKMERLAARLEN